MTAAKYGKTIDGMISLFDLFNRRKIRFALKYAFVRTEEMALRDASNNLPTSMLLNNTNESDPTVCPCI